MTRALAVLAVFLSTTAACVAQAPRSFYAGKTLTIVVGSTPGGYYDIVCRVLARHIGRFIDGNPNIVVQNDPVAGGMALANRLANTMAPDGLTIVAMNRALPQLALAGDAHAQFDPLRLVWLGSLSSYRDDAYLMIVRDGQPARTLADLRAAPKPLHFGGTRAGATNVIFPLLARDVLKLPLEIVRGFPGSADLWLAEERGEIDGHVTDLSAVLVAKAGPWKEGKLHPVLAFGRAERLRERPDVPLARELATDPDDAALLEFAELPFFMALPFAAPPGVPAERAKALGDALMNVARDEAFLAEAGRDGFVPSPVDGAAVRALLDRAANTPASVREKFRRLLAD